MKHEILLSKVETWALAAVLEDDVIPLEVSWTPTDVLYKVQFPMDESFTILDVLHFMMSGIDTYLAHRFCQE